MGYSWLLTSSSSVTTRQSKQVCFALAAPSVRVKKKKGRAFDVVLTEFDSISVEFDSILPEFDVILPAFNVERGGRKKTRITMKSHDNSCEK